MYDTKQKWFKDAKYGLFIHWGLYSLLGGEYKGRRTDRTAEWIENDLDIPAQEYEKLALQFDHQHFDADEIVRRAKQEWGMRYLVFTSKHHEGFAMFDSACNDFNVVKATPYGKDILRQFEQACRKYDMKFCLYYSQVQDWDDPNGYRFHKDNSNRDFQQYLDTKCKPQLRELLTQYGPISMIWFDTPMTITVRQTQELIDLVRSLQPECLISGRIGNHMGDYMATGDNFIPRLPYPGDWEVPATVNDTWGFKKDDQNWKSADDILHLLLKINSRGGNYLLNIGPDADGCVPEGCTRVLDTVGRYLRENAEAVYETQRMEPYAYEINGIELTRRPHKLYVHVLKPLSRITLLNVGNKVTNAYLVADGTPLAFECSPSCEGDGYIEVSLPIGLQVEKNFCVCLEMAEADPIFEPLMH